MKNILLTGANGFLGQELARSLVAQNNIIKTLDIQMPCDYRIDLSKEVPLLGKSAFDLVIHAAGKAHSVPSTKDEEQLFYEVNLNGTINLCKALEHLQRMPETLIFISTVAVYGVDFGFNITEDHPLKGDTPYAKSKIKAEQYLTTWCKKNNVKLFILRLPLIAGLNPPGNLGVMIGAIKRGIYCNIGQGSAKKSMVNASDVAGMIPNLVEHDGIYNLTDGYHPSFKELGRLVAMQLGKKEPKSIPLWLAKFIAKIGDVLGGPLDTDKLNKIIKSLTFSDQKARKLLGWSPKSVLERFKIQ